MSWCRYSWNACVQHYENKSSEALSVLNIQWQVKAQWLLSGMSKVNAEPLAVAQAHFFSSLSPMQKCHVCSLVCNYGQTNTTSIIQEKSFMLLNLVYTHVPGLENGSGEISLFWSKPRVVQGHALVSTGLTKARFEP